MLPFFVYAQNIPQPAGWVNDFAGVISQEYKDKLNSLIGELQEKTSAEIAVVTVDSIAPYDEQGYARLLFDNWKPGKKGKDNGVLVLLAIKERRWRIETGYGVEGILPDGVCGEIGREFMVPYFKDGRYGEGFYAGVSQLARIIARDARVALDTPLAKDETVPLKQGNIASSGSLPIFALLFFTVWNIPLPIFFGLPFTLLFAASFMRDSVWVGIFALIGYCVAMVIRYRIWRNIPEGSRPQLWKIFIFGLAVLGSRRYRDKYGYYGGGFGGGGFGGGGFGGGGFGGGGGGGGGAGGGF